MENILGKFLRNACLFRCVRYNPIRSKIILSLFFFFFFCSSSSSSCFFFFFFFSPCIQRLTQAASAEESHAVLHDYVDNDLLGCSNENDTYHVRLISFVISNDFIFFLFCTFPTLKLLTLLSLLTPSVFCL